MNQEVFSELSQAMQRGEAVALVTIVSASGSTPQRVGAKMLVWADGRTVGTIGGGCYENDAFGKARAAIADGRSSKVRYELSDDFAEESGLICGGQMEVFIEPLEPAPDVYIFGAGHVGAALARMAHDTGFRVHLIDDREKFADAASFVAGIDVVVADIPDWLSTHPLHPTCVCCRRHTGAPTRSRHTAPARRSTSSVYRNDWQSSQGSPRIRGASGGECPPGSIAAHTLTNRSGHWRGHAAGNRGEHPGRTDCRQARACRRRRLFDPEPAVGRCRGTPLTLSRPRWWSAIMAKGAKPL